MSAPSHFHQTVQLLAAAFASVEIQSLLLVGDSMTTTRFPRIFFKFKSQFSTSNSAIVFGLASRQACSAPQLRMELTVATETQVAQLSEMEFKSVLSASAPMFAATVLPQLFMLDLKLQLSEIGFDQQLPYNLDPRID